MILRFEADCAWATLHGRVNMEMVALLDRALSYTEPGAFFSPIPKWKRGDDRTHLLVKDPLAFPAGLAVRVQALLKEMDVTVEIDDQRPEPPWGATVPPVPDLDGINADGSPFSLAPDQRAVIRTALETRRGCLALSVGFGKTECGAAILKAAAPARGLFIVNKRTLLTQTADRFDERLGKRVGRIGDNHADTDRRVTVATIQTLSRRLEEYRDFLAEQLVLIVDECHGIAPVSFFPVLRAIPAPVRIGLSATVREATRRMAVEAYLGPIIAESGEQALIATGRGVAPTIYMLRAGGMLGETEEWQAAYQKGIVTNALRNNLVIQLVRRFQRRRERTLVLVVKLEHGRTLADALGVPFLEGRTDMDTVTRAKRDFAAGRVPVIVASTIFDFGQDIPTIQALITAGGWSSPLRTIQRLGRALRAAPGKTDVTIVDFYDGFQRTLKRHSDERLKTYQKKKFQVKVIGSLDELP